MTERLRPSAPKETLRDLFSPPARCREQDRATNSTCAMRIVTTTLSTSTVKCFGGPQAKGQFGVPLVSGPVVPTSPTSKRGVGESNTHGYCMRVRVRVRGGFMSNESVTECHGIRHYICTISLTCTILYASIYGQVIRGSKPLECDVMHDMWRLNNHCRGVV